MLAEFVANSVTVTMGCQDLSLESAFVSIVGRKLKGACSSLFADSNSVRPIPWSNTMYVFVPAYLLTQMPAYRYYSIPSQANEFFDRGKELFSLEQWGGR